VEIVNRMERLPNLFAKNQAWAKEMVQADPQFFQRLANQQAPEHLWIQAAFFLKKPRRWQWLCSHSAGW